MESTKTRSFPGGTNSEALEPYMEYLMKYAPVLLEATVREWCEEVALNTRNIGLNVTSRLLGTSTTLPEFKGEDLNSRSDDRVPTVIRGYLGVVMDPT